MQQIWYKKCKPKLPDLRFWHIVVYNDFEIEWFFQLLSRLREKAATNFSVRGACNECSIKQRASFDTGCCARGRGQVSFSLALSSTQPAAQLVSKVHSRLYYWESEWRELLTLHLYAPTLVSKCTRHNMCRRVYKQKPARELLMSQLARIWRALLCLISGCAERWVTHAQRDWS